MDKHTRRNLQPRILDPKCIKASGVLFLALDTGRCLLQLRNSNKKHKHTWGFFGGILEKTETPYQAIQRELFEEIGFVPELQKLNPLDTYQSRDRGFMYHSFVYVVEQEFQPTLNAESAGYAWVNIGVWPKPLHEGCRATLEKNDGNEKLRTILSINKQ